MSIESRRYRTVQNDNKFEIREYEGWILTEVEIDGDYDSALRKEFGVLADSIFGGNISKADINMAVPVTGQAVSSEKIEMTVPVTSPPIEEDKKSKIAFNVPSLCTLESLPEPSNKTIFFAQYNPPWIPGVFRRNEVLTEV